MEEPKATDTKPCSQEMEPGTYFWCSCGLSADGVFCDGSHKGTKFRPEKIVIDEKKKVSLCLCRKSAKGALCDGSHKSMPK